MTMIRDTVERLPFWEHLSSDEKALVLEQSVMRTFDAGQLIGGGDGFCTGVFLIVRGGIRASLLSEEGKEVTLFRVGSGECCVTTASCVIWQISFGTLVTATGSKELRLTQDELARDINSAREAVTRVLRRLADDDLIEVSRGRILVHDVEALERLL